LVLEVEGMKNEESSEQELGELVEKKDKDRSKRKGYGELSQSRAAVFTAVGIIFALDLLVMLFLGFVGEIPKEHLFGTDFRFILTIIINFCLDLFLGINLLRGKSWARTWMLIRLVGGIILWGGVLVIQGDFGSVILNTGVLLALILLLTGVSTRLRLVGSVALAVVATLVGMAWTVMPPLTTLPKTPETPIPESFSTYTSEGFFSISYPPDWVPVMSIIEELEKEIKLYGKSLGLESQVREMQVVFSAGKKTEDGGTLYLTVLVQPRDFWPLDTMVEAANEWAKENIEQYVEYSRVSTTIGGKKAIIQTYQGYDVDHVLSRYTISYVVGEEFIWTVVCGSDSQNFDAYADTFDDIVRSLRVEY